MKKALIQKLKSLDFPDEIVRAFERVDRSEFVPEMYREFSYLDKALSIGYGQTISQPYTIAFMLSLLDLDDAVKILEVGSGSGFVLSLLSEIKPDANIHGVEKVLGLVRLSRRRLKNKNNIQVHKSSKTLGLKEKALFDRILVSASASEIPNDLLDQLKFGGTMVCPVRESILQIKKREEGNKVTEHPGFLFVKLQQ